MPKGIASRIREAIAKEDKTGLVLKRATGKSKTGFVGVIKVGNLFQGRLQVKGDGRGGRLKRRQVSLPGLWKTAEEAARMLAILEKAGPEKLWPGRGGRAAEAGHGAQAAIKAAASCSTCPIGGCSHASSLCCRHAYPVPDAACAHCSCAPDVHRCSRILDALHRANADVAPNEDNFAHVKRR